MFIEGKHKKKSNRNFFPSLLVIDLCWMQVGD